MQCAQLPEGFVEEVLADQLDPVRLVFGPQGHIYIAEKNGRISMIKNGQKQSPPFLEIPVDNYDERGLGGFAFDLQFEEKPYVYVYYTVPEANHNRLSRFEVRQDLAVAESEVVLMDFDPLVSTVHNGGDMFFASDGTLFVAVGDGHQAGKVQRLDNLLGKVIRIHPNGTIPGDNPYAQNLDGRLGSIYAIGFRNPFTIAYNHITHQIYVNDVGQASWEEINEVIPAGNYGWPIKEGSDKEIGPTSLLSPALTIPHDPACAIVGGAFYTHEEGHFPERYHGKYFFGDYCSGTISVLDPSTRQVMEIFASSIDRPVSIKVGPDGCLYYLERGGIGDGSEADNTASFNGKLYRISYIGDGRPYIAEHPHDIRIPIGETAQFAVRAFGDHPMTYTWFTNDEIIPGHDQPTLVLPNMPREMNGTRVACAIRNQYGSAKSHWARIELLQNTRPEPVISTPAFGSSYSAGDTIFFSGSANDREDGLLSGDDLTWRIDFFHDDHTHPALLPVSGTSHGIYPIPVVGETETNVGYRIYLTATDHDTLSRSVYTDIFPRTSDIMLTSQPDSIPLFIDGVMKATPLTMSSVSGMIRTFSVPDSIEKGGHIYKFQNWSHGHPFPLLILETPDEDLSLRAVYKRVKFPNMHEGGSANKITLGRIENHDGTGSDQMEIQGLRVSCYPIPFDDEVHLEITATGLPVLDIIVYDRAGTIVYSYSHQMPQPVDHIELGIDHLPEGRYYICVKRRDNPDQVTFPVQKN